MTLSGGCITRGVGERLGRQFSGVTGIGVASRPLPERERPLCNEAQAPTGEMAETPPSIRKSAPTTYAESSDAR
jgi:hypothetical protein